MTCLATKGRGGQQITRSTANTHLHHAKDSSWRKRLFVLSGFFFGVLARALFNRAECGMRLIVGQDVSNGLVLKLSHKVVCCTALRFAAAETYYISKQRKTLYSAPCLLRRYTRTNTLSSFFFFLIGLTVEANDVGMMKGRKHCLCSNHITQQLYTLNPPATVRWLRQR